MSRAFIIPSYYGLRTSSSTAHALPHHGSTVVSRRRQRRPTHHYSRSRSNSSTRPIIPARCTAARSAAAYDPDFDPAVSSSSSTPPPQSPSPPQWEQVGPCDVLLPGGGGDTTTTPAAMLVFLGGLGAGMSPPTFYGNLLQQISKAGNVGIVAYRLPAIPSTDHLDLARSAARDISHTLSLLPASARTLPCIGIGHSLGSKLLLLACTDVEARRELSPSLLQACIFMSFNNSKLRQALPDMSGTANGLNAFINGLFNNVNNSIGIPGVSMARDTVDAVMRSVKETLNSQQRDFTPDPQATLALAGARFAVKRNLVVSFDDDEIDDGADLIAILKARFGQQSNAVVMQRALPGTHLTPVAPDFSNSTFASLGNVRLDETVRRAGMGVTKEVDATVAVIVAFIRLSLQMTTNSDK